MNTLNSISSSQYADSVMGKIDENFDTVKSAIDVLEQSGGGGGSSTTTVATPKYINNPFQIWKSELRVLCLGNSYTYTPMMYLGELVDAASIDKTKFRIEVAYNAGYSLQQWLSDITNDTVPSKYLMGGGTLDGTTKTSGGIRTMIGAKQWDVIVLQQNSDNSTDYSTFEPYLTKIVNAIRRYCPNQKVCIAWQQTWSKNNYATNWGLINSAAKSMIVNNGIDYIIPTGTAIQNARNVSPWSEASKGLMFDASGHLAAGVARYVGACTWFQSLLAPIFNVSVVGNSAIHDTTNSNDYMDTTYYGGFGEEASGYSGNGIQITSSNKLNAQLCAVSAITDMWNITTIS